jgi:hypothetical protein
MLSEPAVWGTNWVRMLLQNILYCPGHLRHPIRMFLGPWRAPPPRFTPQHTRVPYIYIYISRPVVVFHAYGMDTLEVFQL